MSMSRSKIKMANFFDQLRSGNSKVLTRGAFSSASNINACSINVAILAASCKVPRQCHFEEVVSGVNTVVGQVEDAAQVIDSGLGFSQCHLARFCARSDVKLAVAGRTTFGIG